MPALRTLLASGLILAAGLASLAAITAGFHAFTTETARRLAIAHQPRAIPAARLETAQGDVLDLARLRGRWLLVDFIYTRCMTYCSVQGNEFARLQERLRDAIEDDRVALLSISFDPEHDGPAALAAYQKRSGDRGRGWIATRPADTASLRPLLDAFEVKAIPDGSGGFVHNAAIEVVDPQGRLVAVFDWDAASAAATYVADRLAD